MTRTIPLHAAADLAGFVGAKATGTILSISRGHRVDYIAGTVSAIDHEEISVLLYVIPGHPPPIYVTKWRAEVISCQQRASTDVVGSGSERVLYRALKRG